MLLYCLKCRKNKKSKTPKVARTKNVSMMFLAKCAACDGKKSKFTQQQEASDLLSSLGSKTHLIKFL